MKLSSLLLMSAALCAATGVQAQTVAASINGDANAAATSWNANNVGWYYTPTSSYVLAGIATKFYHADDRTVTASLYSGSVDSGLTLLGTGTLLAGTTFTTSIFTPVSLTSGKQYFFAFGNVAGLGVNVTMDAGATSLPGDLRYDFNSSATPTYQFGPFAGFVAQPIVRFYKTGAVPEPATWAMMVAGFAMVGFGLRRRARQPARVASA